MHPASYLFLKSECNVLQVNRCSTKAKFLDKTLLSTDTHTHQKKKRKKKKRGKGCPHPPFGQSSAAADRIAPSEIGRCSVSMWCQWRKVYSFWRGSERKQFHKGYFTQALEERWMQTAQGWVVMRTRAAAPGRAAEPGGRTAPRAQLGSPSRRGLPSLLPPGAGPRTRSPNPPRAEWRAPGQAPRRSRSPEKMGGGSWHDVTSASGSELSATLDLFRPEKKKLVCSHVWAVAPFFGWARKGSSDWKRAEK